MEMSEHFMLLDEVHKQRYLEKIAVINCDPYTFKVEDCSVDLNNFPKVMYPDIVQYFLYKKSAFTMDELKSYKSLEAYNQAVCGWVRKICVKVYGDTVIVLGKVMHSQRLSEKLLSPWTITRKEGEILSAHCDCMAGLGETCTHVAALLFSIDIVARKLEEETVTGRKAYWMPPTNKPSVPSRIADIDLAPPKKRLKRDERDRPLRCREPASSQTLSEAEQHSLLEKLARASEGCVLHTVTKPFSETIAKMSQENERHSLLSLYQKDYENNSLEELQEIGAGISIYVDYEKAKSIEKDTKDQRTSKLWWLYRAGRITASVFKRACRTSLTRPSLSLIKTICYPTRYKGKVAALEYGCQHERTALGDFMRIMRREHPNISSEKCGLFINPSLPMFGASPDALIECACCGTGLVEIKCPYCARNSGFIDLLERKTFFFSKRSGELEVKSDHTYYYQVQMQLGLTHADYCYLVAWSQNELLFKKITFDQQFFEENVNKAKIFFYSVILPEILGRYFTKDTTIEDAVQQSDWDVINEPIDFYQEEVETSEAQEFREESIQTLESVESRKEEEEEVSEIQGIIEEELQAYETNLQCAGETERSDEAKAQEKIPEKPVYCICQKEDDGTPMIACDGVNCELEWFHFQCVGLSEVPRGLWYCEGCLQRDFPE